MSRQHKGLVQPTQHLQFIPMVPAGLLPNFLLQKHKHNTLSKNFTDFSWKKYFLEKKLETLCNFSKTMHLLLSRPRQLALRYCNYRIVHKIRSAQVTRLARFIVLFVHGQKFHGTHRAAS
jgi:hypothetical protein